MSHLVSQAAYVAGLLIAPCPFVHQNQDSRTDDDGVVLDMLLPSFEGFSINRARTVKYFTLVFCSSVPATRGANADLEQVQLSS